MTVFPNPSHQNCGIYSITHVDSGKRYIGSSVRITERIYTHKSRLRKGRHYNQFLQRAWNKHGENAFRFETLLICEKKDVMFYEQLVMDGFRAADSKFGFNARKKAENMLAFKHSIESRHKISAANRNRRGLKYRPYVAGNITKTHCPQGHPYSGDNLYIHPHTNRRDCRACRTVADQKRRGMA